MNASRSILPLIFLSCVLSMSAAFGLAGDLSQPSLAFPTGSPLSTPVMAVVSDKEFKFLHGFFVNGHTTLEYGGDVAALNKFLSRLAACGPVDVNVTFTKEDSDTAWTVGHNAWGSSSSFRIVVNSAKIDEHAVKVPAQKPAK